MRKIILFFVFISISISVALAHKVRIYVDPDDDVTELQQSDDGTLWEAVPVISEDTPTHPPIPIPPGLIPDPLGDWFEGGASINEGVNMSYYNSGMQLRWKNKKGDWTDRSGIAQGDDAYASRVVSELGPVEWDVTELFNGWINEEYHNKGVLLRTDVRGASTNYYSKEYEDHRMHPRLFITHENGDETVLIATGDSTLPGTTRKYFGESTSLTVHRDSNVIIKFDLHEVPKAIEAKLILYAYRKTSVVSTVKVFRLSQTHRQEPIMNENTLSTQFTDEELVNHPDVYLVDFLDSPDWKDNYFWNYKYTDPQPVESDPDLDFVPLDGPALKVTVEQGRNQGQISSYHFKEQFGSDVYEAYFRYYIRPSPNFWNETGGKWPGFASTYRGGSSGDKSTGYNGWSARSHMFPAADESNPHLNLMPFGSYVYHVDQVGLYGDPMIWDRNYAGLLPRNDWSCVEVFVRANTVDQEAGTFKNDGVITSWVNDELAFHKDDFVFRKIETFPEDGQDYAGENFSLERAWFGTYYGGKPPTDKDLTVYYDNLIIAKSPIGCRVLH